MLVTDKYNYDVAIHLIVEGSEFEDFVKFRDALIADFRLVEEYNKLKSQHLDSSVNKYREEKNKFISMVLKQ